MNVLTPRVSNYDYSIQKSLNLHHLCSSSDSHSTVKGKKKSLESSEIAYKVTKLLLHFHSFSYFPSLW